MSTAPCLPGGRGVSDRPSRSEIGREREVAGPDNEIAGPELSQIFNCQSLVGNYQFTGLEKPKIFLMLVESDDVLLTFPNNISCLETPSTLK